MWKSKYENMFHPSQSVWICILLDNFIEKSRSNEILRRITQSNNENCIIVLILLKRTNIRNFLHRTLYSSYFHMKNAWRDSYYCYIQIPIHNFPFRLIFHSYFYLSNEIFQKILLKERVLLLICFGLKQVLLYIFSAENSYFYFQFYMTK